MTNKFEAIENASKGEITVEMRPVYVVSGANHAYLSQGGALNKLAYIIAEKQFHAEGKQTNEPAQAIRLENGATAWKAGAPRDEFIERKNEVLNELKAALRHENDIVKLKAEYEKANNKVATEQMKVLAIATRLKLALNK